MNEREGAKIRKVKSNTPQGETPTHRFLCPEGEGSLGSVPYVIKWSYLPGGRKE